MDTTTTRIAPDSGGIKPNAVERSLRDLWNQMNKDDHAHSTQTRTLNLLVYLPEPPSDELRSRITGVSVQHPGRTITLQPEPGPVHAEVSIACRAGAHANLNSCGEQIVLRGGEHGEALHSLALGLLLPGLPSVLWWHGTPTFKEHPFMPLAEAVDHVMLDSRSWEQPLQVLATFAEARQRLRGKIKFSDLQWAAITPWRQLVAQSFDAEASRTMLDQVSSVLIEYCGKQYEVGALLLAGWLMSRLGWQVGDEPAMRDATGVIVPLKQGDQRLLLALRLIDRDEGIGSVELQTDGEQPARCVSAEAPDGLHVATVIEVPPAPPIERLSPLKRLSMAHLIADELMLGGDDAVYDEALTMALALVGKMEGVR